MLSQPVLSKMLARSFDVITDMCAFGLKTPVSKKPMQAHSDRHDLRDISTNVDRTPVHCNSRAPTGSRTDPFAQCWNFSVRCLLLPRLCTHGGQNADDMYFSRISLD